MNWGYDQHEFRKAKYKGDIIAGSKLCEECNKTCENCKDDCDECSKNIDQIDCQDCGSFVCSGCSFEDSCGPAVHGFTARLFDLAAYKEAGFWFPESLTVAEMQGMVELKQIENKVNNERSEMQQNKNG